MLREEKGIIVALKDTKRCSTPIDWGCMMVSRQEEGERNLESKGIKSRPSGYFRVIVILQYSKVIVIVSVADCIGIGRPKVVTPRTNVRLPYMALN